MKKYTQKELRNLVELGQAIDITNHTEADMNLYYRLEQIGQAWGAYGCNGKLFKHIETGQLYAITKRTMAVYAY